MYYPACNGTGAVPLPTSGLQSFTLRLDVKSSRAPTPIRAQLTCHPSVEPIHTDRTRRAARFQQRFYSRCLVLSTLGIKSEMSTGTLGIENWTILPRDAASILHYQNMSTIVASKGVEFSDFHICEDIALNLVPFNDLSIVAGWSNTLHVMGIKEIVLYNEEDIVVGVELVYVLSNQNNSPRIVHGKKTKFPTTIQVAEKERIIAAFVGVDDNKIKSLRFTKTNLDDGNVTTEGYTSTAPNLIYSAAFGEISAFRGTQIRGDEGRLVTLGVQTRHLGPPVKI